MTRFDPYGDPACVVEPTYQPSPTFYEPYIVGGTENPIVTYPLAAEPYMPQSELEHHPWCQG